MVWGILEEERNGFMIWCEGRIFDLKVSSCRRRLLWTKNLSSLDTMCPWPDLLLVQVYLPLIGLMSNKSQSLIRYSIFSLKGSEAMLPPFLWAMKNDIEIISYSTIRLNFIIFKIHERYLAHILVHIVYRNTNIEYANDLPSLNDFEFSENLELGLKGKL